MRNYFLKLLDSTKKKKNYSAQSTKGAQKLELKILETFTNFESRPQSNVLISFLLGFFYSYYADNILNFLYHNS